MDSNGVSAKAAQELRAIAAGGRFPTILADPPWQFQNRTGKIAPEHHRLARYPTMDLDAICSLPVSEVAADTAHLYLWTPNALLPDALQVMRRWAFSINRTLCGIRSVRTVDPMEGASGFTSET